MQTTRRQKTKAKFELPVENREHGREVPAHQYSLTFPSTACKPQQLLYENASPEHCSCHKLRHWIPDVAGF